MTTQGNAHTESISPPARKLPADGHSVAEAIEAATPELRARLRSAVDASKTRLTDWKDGFEDGVRARPIQSVLIAAAVGAAVGLLLGRRSR